MERIELDNARKLDSLLGNENNDIQVSKLYESNLLLKDYLADERKRNTKLVSIIVFLVSVLGIVCIFTVYTFNSMFQNTVFESSTKITNTNIDGQGTIENHGSIIQEQK